MIAFSFETISPADAARILREHDEAVAAKDITNRPRQMPAVKRYAADMQSGRWNPDTGETIKFETADQYLDGKHLVDGQNRLEACKLSGIPLRVYVARGVPRSAFGHIDGGVIRKPRVVLEMAGESDAGSLAAALRWLSLWDDAAHTLVKSNATVSTPTLRQLLDSDPAIRKSIVAARPVRELGLLSVAVAAFLHRVFSKYDAPLADAFISAVSAGANLSEGDPFLQLKNRLTEHKGGRRKHPQRDLIALSIKAFTAKLHGREIKLLVYRRKDPFPSIEPLSLEPR